MGVGERGRMGDGGMNKIYAWVEFSQVEMEMNKEKEQI